MKRHIRKFNEAIENGLINVVFLHVRNFLYAATFLAAGSYSARYDEEAFFGIIVSEHLGIGIICIGVFLMILNLYAGLFRLSKFRYSVSLSALLTIAYVLVSIRVVEVLWHFRDIG